MNLSGRRRKYVGGLAPEQLEKQEVTIRRANCAMWLSIFLLVLFVGAAVMGAVAYSQGVENTNRIIVLEAFHAPP